MLHRSEQDCKLANLTARRENPRHILRQDSQPAIEGRLGHSFSFEFHLKVIGSFAIRATETETCSRRKNINVGRKEVIRARSTNTICPKTAQFVSVRTC